MSDEQEFTGQQHEEDNDFTGFNKKTKRDAVYFNVFDNSICRKSKQALPDWEGPIFTTHPKTKKQVSTWVDRYDHLVAYIANVERYKKEFDDGGKSSGFNITLLAGPGLKKKAILQLSWCEPVLKRFLKVAPNINFEKAIYISVFGTTRNGKTGVAVAFKQGEGNDPDKWQNVPEFWTRDKEEGEPGVPAGQGIPKAIHDEMDDSYDFRAQNNFLGASFFANQLPAVRKIAARHGIETKPEGVQKVQASGGQGPIQQHTMEKQRAEEAQVAAQPVYVPPVVPSVVVAQQPPATNELNWETTAQPAQTQSSEIMDGWKKLEETNAPAPPDDDDWN